MCQYNLKAFILTISLWFKWIMKEKNVVNNSVHRTPRVTLCGILNLALKQIV